MDIQKNIIIWLLESDPSVRWQVHRDLLHSEPEIIVKERKKTEKEGWCKKILEHQDENGIFGGGLYSPKWISTTYSMLLLTELGLYPENKQVEKSCNILLEKGFYSDGGINYWGSFKHSETCVTGIILNILSYFKYKDQRLHELASYLLCQQMPDGGWNCESYKGATHASFHTTINVLEGLNEHLRFNAKNKKLIQKSIYNGIEFLLQHNLFKSHRTGKVIDTKMAMFSFPTRWRYDILRCLDFFRKAGISKDKRMNDAIEILKKRQKKDGKWNLQNDHHGKVYFELEPVGKPNKINTLRALRVLNWWES